MPLEELTRQQVADELGVSERTIVRDEDAIGKRCRICSREEISRLGVEGRRRQQDEPTREKREHESAVLMMVWARRSSKGAA